jgi:RimJ/RimL family protein N-acetyltransferase
MSAESDLNSVELFANRLALRAFTPADAPEIIAAVSPAITRFMSWDPSPSSAAFAEVWRQWLPRMTAGTDLSLVIRLRVTDEFLGVAGIHRIGSAEPEVGIWLKETAHGLGYGRETIGAIVQWAPAHIGAAALIYPVAKQNLPSRRLAESLHGSIVGERNLRKSSGVVLEEVVYRIPAATDRASTAEPLSD